MPRRQRYADGMAHAARHLDHDDEISLEVERAELEAELVARASDVSAGLAPVWARRSLFPHEIAAHVSFAALADDVDRAAAAIGRRLADDRQAVHDLLLGYLADAPNVAVMTGRLTHALERGLLVIPGVGAVVDAGERALRAELERLAQAGAARVVAEAEQQGVLLVAPPSLDDAAAAHLDAQARRLAVEPHLELVRTLQSEAARSGRLPVADALQRLSLAGDSLAQAPLDQLGRNAASSADGLGRQAVVDAAGLERAPARIYASEILDGNTCGPCSLVDGREYPDISSARVDYPTGIYARCEGRERCRGTLVFVWPEEFVPTLTTPFGL